MTDVIPARMTHDYDGDLVVFLIGMRINKPWRPDLWLPVFFAMPAMLAELSKDKNSGLLGYRLTFGAGGPLVVQTRSCTPTPATGMQRTGRRGRPSTDGYGKLRAPSASGTRRMSSSEPKRSTQECLCPVWPPRPPLSRWRVVEKPHGSGSVHCRRPKVRAPIERLRAQSRLA